MEFKSGMFRSTTEYKKIVLVACLPSEVGSS